VRLIPRLPQGNVNVSQASLLRDFALPLAGVAAMAALLYVLLGLAVDVLAPRIPADLERRMARHLVDGHPLLREARPAPPALAELAERTRQALGTVPHAVDLRVLRSGEVNAFALPGGRVVLTTGLLQALEYENELVFTLGHEMGHLAARDHLRGLGRGLVLAALATLLSGDGDGLGGLLEGMLDLGGRRFSRAQELAADQAGLDAVVGVYGHAGGLDKFFDRLGDDGSGGLAALGRTHPEAARRLAALEATIRRRALPVAAPLSLRLPRL